MSETTFIVTFYQLVDPRDNLPFYVGQTISPEERLKSYLNGRPHYHSRALTRRLRELEQAGLQPIMQELERKECTDAEALQREAYWIQHLGSQGIVLLNKSNGNRGWKQKTVYLPPDLIRWLSIKAIEEDREISEIVALALKDYQERHPERTIKE